MRENERRLLRAVVGILDALGHNPEDDPVADDYHMIERLHAKSQGCKIVMDWPGKASYIVRIDMKGKG